MSDFIASLALLLALMFCGVASWLLLPIIIAIRLPLSGNSTVDAFGKLASDLLGVYIFVSLTVQLTRDHQTRNGSLSAWYPYVGGLLIFVFILEASIAKRQEIIKEASKWSEFPEHAPEIRFWRVVPSIVLPLYILLFVIPSANVPYLYSWFSGAVDWLFHLRLFGSFVQMLAEIVGTCLFFGACYYLLFRTLALFRRASNWARLE